MNIICFDSSMARNELVLLPSPSVKLIFNFPLILGLKINIRGGPTSQWGAKSRWSHSSKQRGPIEPSLGHLIPSGHPVCFYVTEIFVVVCYSAIADPYIIISGKLGRIAKSKMNRINAKWILHLRHRVIWWIICTLLGVSRSKPFYNISWAVEHCL